MRNFTDVDLAELAEWAESKERELADPNEKKGYAAIRQGADWLVRFRTIRRQKDLEAAGMTNDMTKAVRQ